MDHCTYGVVAEDSADTDVLDGPVNEPLMIREGTRVVNGDVNVTKENAGLDLAAVEIQQTSGTYGNVSITVNGNVSVTNEFDGDASSAWARGVMVRSNNAINNDSVAVTVNGDVAATSAKNSNSETVACGVYISTNKPPLNISTGNVTARGQRAEGLSVSGSQDSHTTVHGSVLATTDGCANHNNAIGIYLCMNGGKPSVVVTGDVTAQNATSGSGIKVITNGGTTDITVGGTISGKSGILLEKETNNG